MSATERQVGGSHYLNLKIQPAAYAHANGLGLLEGNVVKYVSRHRQKGGREDIRKAIHCLEMLLELEYPDEGRGEKALYTEVFGKASE